MMVALTLLLWLLNSEVSSACSLSKLKYEVTLLKCFDSRMTEDFDV